MVFTMRFTYYIHILHPLQAMNMKFSKLFLICMFKDQNLEENCINLVEKLKKLNPVDLTCSNSGKGRGKKNPLNL